MVRLQPVLFGVALAMFAVQFQVGTAMLTTNRLGVVIMLCAIMLRGARGRVFRLRRRSALELLMTSLFVLFVFSLASYIVASPREAIGIGPIVSWAIIGVASVCSYVLWSGFDDSDAEVVLRSLIIIGAVATMYTFVFAMGTASIDSISDYYSLRHLLNEFGGGINRHLVGLLTLNAFCLAAITGLYRAPLWLMLVAWIDVAMFVILTVLTGSRQTMLGLVLLTAGCMVLRPRSRTRRNRSQRLRVLVLGSVGVLVVGMGFQHFDLRAWFERRFIATTVQQANAEAEYGRLAIAITGIEIALSSPVVGIGPGAFESRVGHAAHNGYVGVAAEIGIVPVAAMIVVWLFTLWRAVVQLRRQVDESSIRSFLTTGTCYLFVYVVVLTLLNDLSRQYIPWVMMAALIAGLEVFRRPGGRLATRHLHLASEIA